jgi:phospholipase/carboxylesterase
VSGTTVANRGLDLRLRPSIGAPAGALVLNHGRGADEHDLFPLLEALDPERRLLGVTTGAPLEGIAPGGRHWYVVERVGFPDPGTFGPTYEALGERLDALLVEHGVDHSQAVLGGFSQGAVMSYALALGPGRPTPAGLVALSGFIPTVAGWRPELSGRASMRALVHHGLRDPVISAELGARAARTLSEAGVAVDHLATDAGHWVPPEAVERARALLEATV